MESDMEKNMDMYICKECGKEMKKLLPTHLALHGLTREQYFEKYPTELNVYKTFINASTKKNSANCIEYYLHRGMTQEEAETALQNHRTKLGESIAKVRHLNPLRYDYWMAKGYTKEQAKEILSKRNSHDLNFYKEKYGEVLGTRMYADLVKHHSESRCEETQVKKISKKKNITEDQARDEFKTKKRTSSPRCKDHWIAKGFTEDEAKDMIRRHQLRDLTFFVKKYGEVEGTEKYKEFCNRSHRGGIASRESLKVLIPIYKHVRRVLKIPREDIFIGLVGSREKRLVLDRDSNTTKYTYFAYDFTIESLKIIIEYHGERWHPNPNNLSKADWENWVQVYTKESADVIYERDKLKKALAEKNGYTYVTIWSSDCKADCINNIKQLLGS